MSKKGSPMLSEEERNLIDILDDVGDRMNDLCTPNGYRRGLDLSRIDAHIVALQEMIMSQGAARFYDYAVLGGEES